MILFQKNILLREIRVNRRSWLIWTLSMSLLTIITMWVYPAVANEQVPIEQLIAQYPKELLVAFGLDELRMSDLLGFYASENYIFILLFGSIFAISLAGGILAKEESEKTGEFLLAKPVTRRQVITSKLLAVLFYVLAFDLVQLLTALATFEWVKQGPYSVKTLLWLLLGASVVHLVFVAIGLALSAFVSKVKTITPMGVGLVLGTYFLSLLAKLSSKLDFFKYVSPFKYADAVDIVKRGRLDVRYLTLALAIIVILLAFTYYFYQRKDLAA